MNSSIVSYCSLDNHKKKRIAMTSKSIVTKRVAGEYEQKT